MLAEVRALREGIIIADQLPTAMAPEVIKNTNIKLIHRLMLCKFTLISISMKILVICIQPKLKTAVQYSQMK